MKPEPFLQLYDPRNGDFSLRVEPFDSSDDLAAPQRTNCFTVFWVQEGAGSLCAESGQYPFAKNSLLFLVPYQAFRLVHNSTLRGLCLKFHANFLCIETYHEEIGCNGVLVTDTNGAPCVNLEECHAREAAAFNR